MRAFLFSCAIGAAAISSASISFTFDTDNQGWTRGDFGNGFANITVNSSGAATWGTPGQLNGTDHSGYAYHFSGNLGGGHGNLMGGTISLDFQFAGSSGEDPFLVLMSSTDFLVLEHTVTPPNTMVNYSFNLDSSAGWFFNSSQFYQGNSATVATNAQILSVLSDLQHIGVSTDITNGGDTTRTDNVNLQAVPEPATMTILALGALAALRKKKNA